MRCLSVRWNDLDSATLVSELGKCGHSAIGVDVEIWRLLRHYDLLIVEAKRLAHCLATNTSLAALTHLPSATRGCAAISEIVIHGLYDAGSARCQKFERSIKRTTFAASRTIPKYELIVAFKRPLAGGSPVVLGA